MNRDVHMSSIGRVLVIDDEDSLRRTLTRVLRSADCEVASAADGHEALRRLAVTSYDLVFLDIRLPEMDGLEVLQKIRQTHPRLPVIMLTAHASLQSALEALRLGASDYLLKPITPETLVSRTRVILNEQAVLRRRREIQTQMDALQAELDSLETADEIAAPVQSPTPQAFSPEDRFLQLGPLILDLHSRRVTLRDRVLNLPPTPFDYLVVFARHSPDIVDYQTLIAEAQGYDMDRREAQELSKYHIHVLRDVLEPDSKQPRHILNVRGVGYRLLVD